MYHDKEVMVSWKDSVMTQEEFENKSPPITVKDDKPGFVLAPFIPLYRSNYSLIAEALALSNSQKSEIVLEENGKVYFITGSEKLDVSDHYVSLKSLNSI